MRIETESSAKNIDSILTGNFEKPKIWLIFKVHENESFSFLFKDGQSNENYNEPDIFSANEGNDEFPES